MRVFRSVYGLPLTLLIIELVAAFFCSHVDRGPGEVIGGTLVIIGPGVALIWTIGKSRANLAERMIWATAAVVAICVGGALVLNLTSGLTRSAWLVLLVIATAGILAVGVLRPASISAPKPAQPIDLEPVGTVRMRGRRKRVFLLCAALGLGAGAVVVSVASVDATPTPKFTELWLVPPSRTHPSSSLELGVTSHEQARALFRLTVEPKEGPTQNWSFALAPGRTWTIEVKYNHSVSLVADLYKLKSPQSTSTATTPYRQVTYSAP